MHLLSCQKKRVIIHSSLKKKKLSPQLTIEVEIEDIKDIYYQLTYKI